jgi:hypothetical protein
MININSLKKIKNKFPIIFGKNIISSKDCQSLIQEIKNYDSFDDLIHGGRNRINKGSKNFKNYLKNSKLSNKLYKQLNSKFFYDQVEKKFKDNFQKLKWSSNFKSNKFLKTKFTNKKFMNSKELSKMFGKTYHKPDINLDFDFSVSKGGYKLRPHRDDITRVYNFLIYLNDIPKKNGGSLTTFELKTQKKIQKDFKRFPNMRHIKKVKEFRPSRGSIIFFQSTPNSYHGVSLFKEVKKRKRFFIYGSYALSKPVIWKHKNLIYYPKIKKTSKRLLTHNHETNYVLKRYLS